MVDKELMSILACPACRADVEQVGEEIICKNCGRAYPIRDGIPVMLVSESRETKSSAGD